MYKYKILKSDGSIEEFKTEKLSLETLQRHVGGFIQLLPQPEQFGIKTTGDVYVNEDGKALNLPANPLLAPTEFDVIVGNVLIEEKI
jgi:hypothetical protein